MSETKQVQVGGYTYDLTAMRALEAEKIKKPLVYMLSKLTKSMDKEESFSLDKIIANVDELVLAFMQYDEDSKLLLAMLRTVVHNGQRLEEAYVNTHFAKRGNDMYLLAWEVFKFNNFLPQEMMDNFMVTFTGSLQEKPLSQQKLKIMDN